MSHPYGPNYVSGAPEEREQYSALLENALTGVIIVQDQRIAFVNPQAAALIDYSPDELLGKDVFDSVHPDDAKRVRQHYLLSQGGRAVPGTFETRLVTRSGQVRHVEFRTGETIYDGAPAIIANVSDITERVNHTNALRSSAERYRLLFDTSPDAVLLLEDDRIAQVNPAAKEVLGRDPEELIGMAPWEISPMRQPSGIDSHEECLRRLRACREQGPQSFEWVHLTDRGEELTCEVDMVDCRLKGQSFVQAIVRDLGARQRKDESRQDMEQSLEDHKRQFYRNTILGFTEGKLDIVEPYEAEQYTSHALVTADFAQRADVSMVRRRAEGFCLEYGLDDERTSVFIMGVGEALSNAAVHAGGGTMRAGVYAGGVWVSVIDHGPGIDSLLLPRATLGKGFSTKPSMGLGFTVILDVCDRVLLNSADQGTTVILMADFIHSPEWDKPGRFETDDIDASI